MPRNKNLTEETSVGLRKAAPAPAPVAPPAAPAIPPEKPEKQEDAELVDTARETPRSRGRGGK